MVAQEYLPATQFGNSGLYSQGYGIQAQVRRKVEQRKILRKKQATLSFKWNDILNRRTPLMRSVTEYGYHESYRPQIRSYVLLSLRYRFSISKRKSEGNHHK